VLSAVRRRQGRDQPAPFADIRLVFGTGNLSAYLNLIYGYSGRSTLHRGARTPSGARRQPDAVPSLPPPTSLPRLTP
jgi:hypothetical protein